MPSRRSRATMWRTGRLAARCSAPPSRSGGARGQDARRIRRRPRRRCARAARSRSRGRARRRRSAGRDRAATSASSCSRRRGPAAHSVGSTSTAKRTSGNSLGAAARQLRQQPHGGVDGHAGERPEARDQHGGAGLGLRLRAACSRAHHDRHADASSLVGAEPHHLHQLADRKRRRARTGAHLGLQLGHAPRDDRVGLQRREQPLLQQIAHPGDGLRAAPRRELARVAVMRSVCSTIFAHSASSPLFSAAEMVSTGGAQSGERRREDVRARPGIRPPPAWRARRCRRRPC